MNDYPRAAYGWYVAKMEITALLTALQKRVARFEPGETKRVVHNVMRGLSKVEVTVHGVNGR